MQVDQQKMWILLTRVLSDEASSSETKGFNQWLAEDPENRAFFEDLQTRWEQAPDNNIVRNYFLFDRESGINKLRYKIREEEEANTSQAALPPATRNGTRLAGWAIAASILLLVGMVSVWVGIRSWSPDIRTYKTSNLQQRIITLPDNSTVRLNKNSTISFRKGLEGPSRKITLQGEAFFEVAHDASRPFVIHAGDAIIRDIGTSFNVKQQNGGKVVVAMKEGEASLRAKNASRRDTSLLTKNQIGILRKGKVSAITEGNIQNYLSWIKGRVVFDEIRFSQVIRQLDNIYGIRSRLGDPGLAELTLTAYTNNTSLDEMLDMIALSLDISYRKVGHRVIWMKNGSSNNQSNNLTDTTIIKKTHTYGNGR